MFTRGTSMYVKANTTPASAPGDFVWETEEDVVEVPDDLGTELLKIAGQFKEVLPSDPEHPEYVAPEPGDVDPPEWQGDPDEDLIGGALTTLGDNGARGDKAATELHTTVKELKKPCGHKGCKNNAKPGQDFCHWHQPKE